MPRSRQFIHASAAIGVVGALAALTAGCSNSPSTLPSAAARPDARTETEGVAQSSTPRASEGPQQSASSGLPADVEATARAFTTAYAEHDARDGRDDSFADSGTRAAQFATGELVGVLSQKRPGQDAEWAALRSEQARQTAEITSVRVPDGAPSATPTTALVRVTYTLTTTSASGQQQSSEQLALRLEHTSLGWRVTALPWA